MEKKKLLDRDAIVLAMDIRQIVDRRGMHYQVICTRPGAQGRFSREWTTPSGPLSADQATDLASWVTNSVMNALVAWGGVQDAWPL